MVPESGFVNRSLFYWAQLYSGQLRKGEQYKELRPVVCINIMDFTLSDDLSDGHNCFMVKHTENSEYVLTEDLSLHFIELAKPMKRGTRLQDWMEFIAGEGRGKDMTVLLTKDLFLRKAHEEFERSAQDEEVQGGSLVARDVHTRPDQQDQIRKERRNPGR